MQLRICWWIGVSLAYGCGDDGGRMTSAGSTMTPITSLSIGSGDPSPTGGPTDSGASESASGTEAASGDVTATGMTMTMTMTMTGPTSMTGPVTTTSEPDTGDSDSSAGQTTGGSDLCKVQDDMNAIGECGKEAPPDSFEPEVQWAWTGPNGEIYAVVTPLVANLTDDNQDGAIDLCDVPDIVIPASSQVAFTPGHIYVLDGATGAVHFMMAAGIDPTVTPALGDIDGDGLPEIISATVGGQLIAWEHDGTLKWMGGTWAGSFIAALGVADVDNDGDVEIFGSNQLFDHTGTLLWTAPGGVAPNSATAAADLDGDGDLEIVIGHSAVHHDGSMYYQTNLIPGFPQVANLDGDPEPEILLTNNDGISLIEHDGAVKYQNLRPTGDLPNPNVWSRPATIQDFNGDNISDFAVSSGNNYATYRSDATIIWKATVSDQSGVAAGTAFDFLGDGVAEAMYADEQFLFVFDGAGTALLKIQRSSLTGIEYPIVADVDNDGSAEIVVVSNKYMDMSSPTVQVIRDKSDRWIQARRIWNQHTYHVTNVREDGTIPQQEPPSWKSLNTYRTNAQIEGGGLCEPPIPQ